MSAPVLAFRPTPDQLVWTFGGAAPAARIAPGTVLELWTEDCFAGRVRGPDDLVSRVCEFPFLNPQTGPFYVEGAEPGDTIAVHFVSLEPSRDWAQAVESPLANVVDTNYTSVAKVRKEWVPGADVMRGTHQRLREMADEYRSDR